MRISTTIMEMPESAWKTFQQISGFEDTSPRGAGRPKADPVTLDIPGHVAYVPPKERPKFSLPIGFYDYYPDLGYFSPKKSPAVVAVWDLNKVTSSSALHQSMGSIIEDILSDQPQDDVVGRLRDWAKDAVGDAEPKARQFQYPPFIQAVYDFMQGDADSATSKGRGESLLQLLYSFFYDPYSPLYKGFMTKRFHPKFFPQGTQIYAPGEDLHLTRLQDDRLKLSEWDREWDIEKRRNKAGADTGTFNPAIFTALELTGSKANMKPNVAVMTNAAHVLSRSDAVPFDRTQDFPFEMEDSELKPILDQAAEDGFLAENYGKVLINKVAKSKRMLRSDKFAETIRDALRTRQANPGYLRASKMLRTIVSTMMKSGLV